MEVSMLESNYPDILSSYYNDNAAKLHNLCDKILKKFGWLDQKDVDDFYSIANDTFIDVLCRWDGERDFNGLLYTGLGNKFKTYISSRNAIKRSADRMAISLNSPLNDDGDDTMEDIVGDDRFRPDETLEQVEEFMSGLSSVQRSILQYKMDGYNKNETMEILGLTPREYDSEFSMIRMAENIDKLNCGRSVREEKKKMVVITSKEKSKDEPFSIVSYQKKLDSYSIRKDHPLQRHSDQWPKAIKDNLVSSVLNEDRIPSIIICEQIKDGIAIKYLIDGLQRLTTLCDYRNGGFKLGKNIERYEVDYNTVLKDDNGEIIFEKDGSPKYESKTFDIRGKKYADLPSELRERFDDFSIIATIYMNCTDEDVAYHIRRHNAYKPMTAAQKGVTHIGEAASRVVKKLAQHPWFKEKIGCYKNSECTNGTIERVIVESMMAMFFLDDWKKKQEDMCEFIKNNVKVENFNHFEGLLDRLVEIVDDKTRDLFTSKESFILMALFDKFDRTGEDDDRFIDFLVAFKDELSKRPVDGVSYDDLSGKGTKDRSIVIGKLHILETLMMEFLGLQEDIEENDNFDISNIEEYVGEVGKVDIVSDCCRDKKDVANVAVNIAMEISEASCAKNEFCASVSKDSLDDSLFYLESLNAWCLNIDSKAKILSVNNIPKLVHAVKYVYDNDLDEDTAQEWFKLFTDNYEKDGRKKLDTESMMENLRGYMSFENRRAS